MKTQGPEMWTDLTKVMEQSSTESRLELMYLVFSQDQPALPYHDNSTRFENAMLP